MSNDKTQAPTPEQIKRWTKQATERAELISRASGSAVVFIPRILALLSAILAGTIAAFIAINDASSQRQSRELSAERVSQAVAVSSQLRAENESLRRKLQEAQTVRAGTDSASIVQRISKIEEKQDYISDIIVDNPEKSLELPFVRRDIQEMKASSSESAAALRREIDRIYDLNKWLIGGIALAVFGLGLQALLSPKIKRTPAVSDPGG